ncbi:MAG: hypothetical protein WC007_16820 [Pelobacteraceae bacterium]
MNTRLGVTTIALCMPLIMATCGEAEAVEENDSSDCPCFEPAVPDNALRTEQAGRFLYVAELYRQCVTECVDIHTNALKEHRRIITAAKVKWKIFADTCTDREINLFVSKDDGGKSRRQGNKSGRYAGQVVSTVLKTTGD